MIRAALGFRAHSGWAVVAAVASTGLPPRVVDRRRIELADSRTPGSKQPYHAAEPLPLAEAEKWIDRCTRQTRLLAETAVQALIQSLAKQGYRVEACTSLLAAGRALPPLSGILASHALIHTAEGEFFRAALHHAGTRCGLSLRPLKERDLFDCAGRELHLTGADLEAVLKDWGKLLGPPWRQDEKYAAIAAWLALRAD